MGAASVVAAACTGSCGGLGNPSYGPAASGRAAPPPPTPAHPPQPPEKAVIMYDELLTLSIPHVIKFFGGEAAPQKSPS